MNINSLTRFLLLSFLLFATIGLGQINTPGTNSPQTLTPQDAEYQILKDAGMLPANLPGYIPQDGMPTIVAPNGVVPEVKQLTLCEPLIPVDNTFSIVRFSGYSAPSYRNDDGSSAAIPLPFTFCFYGQNFNSIYINNNGNVSFGGAYGAFSSSGFPFNTYVMLAPFWADVDTRNPSSGLVYYRITPTHMVVRWSNVGYYSSMADKVNDFQLIITTGNDSIIPIGTNVQFAYGDMQWTTGSASGGINGFGGTPATVGANLGNNVNYIQFGRFNVNSSIYDGPFGANDGISWLDNKAFYFNACSNTNNIAPIPSGATGCDTIRGVCVGDTLNFNFQFLSPEQGQVTTTTINPTGVPGFTGTATTGNTSTINATFIAGLANVGYNTLTFVGTDNGTPAASTIITYVVYVDVPPQRPVITGDSVLCPGENTLLQTQTGYTNYLWSPGVGNTNTQNVNSAGVYTVSYDSANCTVTSDPFTVIQVPNPIPAFAPPLSSCNTGTALVVADPGYTSYTWLPSPAANDTVNLPPGAYTLTVIDTNGCTGSIPVNIALISNIQASLISSTNASCATVCNGDALIDVQNQLGNITYNWTPNVSSNDFAQNLCVGSYEVVVTDTAGCDDTLNIDITALYDVTTQVTQVDPLCFGSCNGEITIAPLTGVGPYTYNWAPSPLYTPGSTTLCSGIYYITTTDGVGCTVVDTVTLTDPADLRVVPTGTDETCPEFCDGTALLNISGGTPQYSIVWASNLQTFVPTVQPNLTNLCGGDYTYVVTDANGCSENGVIEINTIPQPVAAFSNSSASVNGLDPTVVFVNESSADVTAWNWDFEDVGPSSLEDPTILFPGMGTFDVTLIVTNSYGCTDTTMTTIEIADINVLYIPSAFTPNNNGTNDKFMAKGVLDNDLEFVMYVFNRWGERVFITHSLFEGWDGLDTNGKECLMDAYLYRIVVTNKKAETEQVYIGRVNLIR